MEPIEALAPRCRVANFPDNFVPRVVNPNYRAAVSTEKGIVVSLTSFISVKPEDVNERDIFLRIVQKSVMKEGIDGAFNSEDDLFDRINTYSIVVLDDSGREITEMSYDDSTKEAFPENVVNSAESIIRLIQISEEALENSSADPPGLRGSHNGEKEVNESMNRGNEDGEDAEVPENDEKCSCDTCRECCDDCCECGCKVICCPCICCFFLCFAGSAK